MHEVIIILSTYVCIMNSKAARKRGKNKHLRANSIALDSLKTDAPEPCSPNVSDEISISLPQEKANEDIVYVKTAQSSAAKPYGRKDHIWNNITINLLAFFMGYVVLRITQRIHYWLQKQTDFYAESWDVEQTFQHLPEIKMFYLGDFTNGNVFIPENSNMLGTGWNKCARPPDHRDT